MKQAPEVEITGQEQEISAQEKAMAVEQAQDVFELPMLPVRSTVLFPNVVVPLMVGREPSLKAIEEAASKKCGLFVVTQLQEEIEDPGPDDVYVMGVECTIDRQLKMPDGSTTLLLRGQRRLRRLAYTQQ